MATRVGLIALAAVAAAVAAWSSILFPSLVNNLGSYLYLRQRADCANIYSGQGVCVQEMQLDG